MSTHSRDYGKDNSFKRERDDNDRQRRQRNNVDRHGHPDRRRGTEQRKENSIRDGERRRDRRDYPGEGRRSYGRDHDDRRRKEDRELDNDRDRESRRDHDRDGNHEPRSDRRQRESSRERARGSRRSASPKRRSRSPTRSKSPTDKAKPNFNPSGLLAAATNTVKAADGTSTVLKYNEPPEARKPTLGWRLYVFKGNEQLELLHIHRQSAYLIGRDRTVADIFIEHPSCSKQHAVIQHRQVQEKDEFGGAKAVIKPFIIDLESTNATHVNDEVIPTTRFYELRAGDVIKFGLSNREYVLLHDEST
ncbi:SMAD/FHA domain-containing protein [Imleria badia]|nr:SMAD/FHA domain-containing protein [Imleria badia]